MSLPRQKGIPLTVDVPRELPQPEAANWFHFSQHAAETQMLVGYIDSFDIAKAQQQLTDGVPEPKLRPLVTRRVVVSLSAFLFLRQQVEDIYGQMVRNGLVIEENVSSPVDEDESHAG